MLAYPFSTHHHVVYRRGRVGKTKGMQTLRRPELGAFEVPDHQVGKSLFRKDSDLAVRVQVLRPDFGKKETRIPELGKTLAHLFAVIVD